MRTSEQGSELPPEQNKVQNRTEMHTSEMPSEQNRNAHFRTRFSSIIRFMMPFANRFKSAIPYHLVATHQRCHLNRGTSE
jgi:hypothetical protein